MIRRYLTTVAVLFYVAFPSQKVNGQDVSDFGEKLLDSRRAITSYYAKIELRRTLPEELFSELVVANEGELYRFDRKRISSPNHSNDGIVNRRARLKGVVKQNHSVAGAALYSQEKEREGFVDLRGLGMNLKFFSSLDPEKYSLEKSFVRRVLSDFDNMEVKKVRDVLCVVATRVEGEDRELSIFFEKDSGRYRGCEIVVGDRTTTAWIFESEKISGLEFPTKVKLLKSSNGEINFEESVIVTELEINTELPRDTFEFSGLGVTPGQMVHVYRGSGPDELEITEMYWSGAELVNSKLLIQTSFWDAPKIIGLLMILFGVFIGASILRKRRAR